LAFEASSVRHPLTCNRLPLGAGAPSGGRLRFKGKAYEGISALIERRSPLDP
jgi:hypothetical protein